MYGWIEGGLIGPEMCGWVCFVCAPVCQTDGTGSVAVWWAMRRRQRKRRSGTAHKNFKLSHLQAPWQKARFMESEKRGGRAQNRGRESCGEREKRWGRRGVGWESFREEERMNSGEEFWQKRWQRRNRGGWNMETRWNFPIANLSVVKMSHSLNLDKDH